MMGTISESSPQYSVATKPVRHHPRTQQRHHSLPHFRTQSRFGARVSSAAAACPSSSCQVWTWLSCRDRFRWSRHPNQSPRYYYRHRCRYPHPHCCSRHRPKHYRKIRPFRNLRDRSPLLHRDLQRIPSFRLRLRFPPRQCQVRLRFPPLAPFPRFSLLRSVEPSDKAPLGNYIYHRRFLWPTFPPIPFRYCFRSLPRREPSSLYVLRVAQPFGVRVSTLLFAHLFLAI
mmetsp:Transcript_21992/g.49870  ORF Transcript_21992/g.49870 Transcript_21992/m.49870 type:complete len:229 (-) Transcript_21992:347-1033(-)